MGLVAVSAFAGDTALDGLLKGVEARYNKAKTLQVAFHEDYTPQGRPRRSERTCSITWESSTASGKSTRRGT